MRFGDLDALRESIKERYEGTEDSTGKWRTYGNYWDACEMIENAPTVDAVPVVRCKDCKWFYLGDCEWMLRPQINNVEWFCPRGERREEDVDRKDVVLR